MNSLADVFSQLKFLSISPQREWSSFNNHIAKVQKKKPTLAARRTQAILKSCTIRRNKNTELNGVRLLTLPERSIEIEELQFSAEERDMYDRIEKRMQVSLCYGTRRVNS